METWIWFLISRPIVSINSNRKPLDGINDKSGPDLGHYHPHPSDNNPRPQLPPNFPDPIPVSWMVFACPLTNITQYPEIIERSPTDNSEEEPEPAHPPAKRGRKPEKLISKRRDYDFSHQGVPKFEFSNAELEMFIRNPCFPDEFKKGNFLSVEGLPPFKYPRALRAKAGWSTKFRFNPGEGIPRTKRYQNESGRDLQRPEDFFGMMSNDDFKLQLAQWEYRVRKEEISDGQRKKEKVECRRIEEEFPCPYYGTWWKLFYEGIYGDEARWRRVKEAMSKGKCRVVIRWKEWEQGEEDEEPEPPRMGMGIEGAGVSLRGVRGHDETRSSMARSMGLGGGRPVGFSGRPRARGINGKEKSAMSLNVPPTDHHGGMILSLGAAVHGEDLDDFECGYEGESKRA
jgi:hypothetical protein